MTNKEILAPKNVTLHLKHVNVGNLVQYMYVQGEKRNIPLDIWLYIRVFLYYILYNFYKRVFEFMCMTKKVVMVFLFFFKTKKTKTAFFQLLPTTFSCGALLHDQRKLQLVIAYIQRVFCERPWYTLYSKTKQTLDCTWMFFDKPWPYTITVHMRCCMKEELQCKLFWYVRWFKMGWLRAVS